MDEKFLLLVKMAIPARGVLKKKLARRCGLSASQFSLVLGGDKEMSERVRTRLIKELRLEGEIKRLQLQRDE